MKFAQLFLLQTAYILQKYRFAGGYEIYSLKADDIMDVLTDLLIMRGVPGHIRSDSRIYIYKRSRISALK